MRLPQPVRVLDAHLQDASVFVDVLALRGGAVESELRRVPAQRGAHGPFEACLLYRHAGVHVEHRALVAHLQFTEGYVQHVEPVGNGCQVGQATVTLQAVGGGEYLRVERLDIRDLFVHRDRLDHLQPGTGGEPDAFAQQGQARGQDVAGVVKEVDIATLRGDLHGALRRE